MSEGFPPVEVTRPSPTAVSAGRVIAAPIDRVYAAWSTAELFRQWWAPRSMGMPISACTMDVRTGGTYRLAFGHDGAEVMTFFGTYREVVPGARLVWTNDEGEGPGALTTVTFAAEGAGTRVMVREDHPDEAACEDSLGTLCAMLPEQFAQLEALLSTL